MFSVTEGDDKPAKHPFVVLESDVVILNKTDLLPYIPFELERFRKDLRSVRGNVALIEMSSVSGEGIEPWLGWLRLFVKGEVGADGGVSVERDMIGVK